MTNPYHLKFTQNGVTYLTEKLVTMERQERKSFMISKNQISRYAYSGALESYIRQIESLKQSPIIFLYSGDKERWKPREVYLQHQYLGGDVASGNGCWFDCDENVDLHISSPYRRKVFIPKETGETSAGVCRGCNQSVCECEKLYGASVGQRMAKINSDLHTPEPKKEETTDQLWHEVIGIYNNRGYGYAELINILNRKFTIQRK